MRPTGDLELAGRGSRRRGLHDGVCVEKAGLVSYSQVEHSPLGRGLRRARRGGDGGGIGRGLRGGGGAEPIRRSGEGVGTGLGACIAKPLTLSLSLVLRGTAGRLPGGIRIARRIDLRGRRDGAVGSGGGGGGWRVGGPAHVLEAGPQGGDGPLVSRQSGAQKVRRGEGGSKQGGRAQWRSRRGPSLSGSRAAMMAMAVERRALGSRTHNSHGRRLLSWGGINGWGRRRRRRRGAGRNAVPARTRWPRGAGRRETAKVVVRRRAAEGPRCRPPTMVGCVAPAERAGGAFSGPAGTAISTWRRMLLWRECSHARTCNRRCGRRAAGSGRAARGRHFPEGVLSSPAPGTLFNLPEPADRQAHRLLCNNSANFSRAREGQHACTTEQYGVRSTCFTAYILVQAPME